jgi:hypothetical protein
MSGAAGPSREEPRLSGDAASLHVLETVFPDDPLRDYKKWTEAHQPAYQEVARARGKRLRTMVESS